jgi:hypothetical protein
MKQASNLTIRDAKARNGGAPITTKFGALQYQGTSNYSVKSIESTTAVFIPNIVIVNNAEPITWDLPARAIYDDLRLKFTFGAFTEDHAADTITRTNPVSKVVWQYGDEVIATRYYEDMVLAHKASSPWIRECNRDEGIFTATETGTQAAFTQTIHIGGMKCYGDSEDLNPDSALFVVPGTNKLSIEITLRDQFTIVDGGVTTPDKPVCTGIKMRAFRRDYDDQRVANEMFKQMGGKLPILIYNSKKVSQNEFTTDATGALDVLTTKLDGTNDMNVMAYGIRVYLATDVQGMDAKVFSFSGNSGIEKNSEMYRKIRDNTDVTSMFRKAHGRVLSSDLPAQYEDGDLLVLASPSSVFEIDQSVTDNYTTTDEARLRIEGITGLAASTTYVMKIHLIFQKGVLFD